MKEHQGCVVSLPIEDIIGQVDRVDTGRGGDTVTQSLLGSKVKIKL